MESYDPLQTPPSAEWLALDESERMHLVLDYHRDAGIDLPRETAHVAIHTIVETQLAMNSPAGVRRTLQRLLAARMDRHEALHAIGSVLAEHMREVMTGAADAETVNERYENSLRELDPDERRGRGPS